MWNDFFTDRNLPGIELIIYEKSMDGTEVPFDTGTCKDVEKMSDAELKIRSEKDGNKFQNTQRIYYSNPNYVLREIAGESVLVSMGEGVADFCGIITLNQSAKILWETLKQGSTREKLAENLKNHFQISDEQAADDVEKSLKLLEEKGLVSCE